MSAESTEPTLPPLAIARVAALLDAQGAKYGTDDDGDLFAAWDGNPFWFMVVGKESTTCRSADAGATWSRARSWAPCSSPATSGRSRCSGRRST